MPQDRHLELAQLRAGIEPELRRKALTRRLEDGESIGLTTVPVQGAHELADEPLAQRMRAHESLQLRDQLAVGTEPEIGLDALLERDKPAFFEALRFDVKRLVCRSASAGPSQSANAARRPRAAAAGSPAAENV